MPLEITLRPGGHLPRRFDPQDPPDGIGVYSVSAVIWEGVTERCAQVPASTRWAPPDGLAASSAVVVATSLASSSTHASPLTAGHGRVRQSEHER